MKNIQIKITIICCSTTKYVGDSSATVTTSKMLLSQVDLDARRPSPNPVLNDPFELVKANRTRPSRSKTTF